MVYFVYSLELPLWGDSNKNIQYTLVLKKIVKILYFASWLGVMINTH